MRKKAVLAFLALTVTLWAGCGKEEDGESGFPPAVEIRQAGQQGGEGQEEGQESTGGQESARGEEQPSGKASGEQGIEGHKPRGDGEEPFGFGDLADTSFYFSSGVGAWYTELSIRGDGSFSGHYQDADMGDTGDSYPNGTLYLCDFEGAFDSMEKVDGFTYKMKLASLTFAREPGTEEILDDTRQIYSTAYGLDDGEEFYLYLPGAELNSLPEDFLSWVYNMNPEGPSGLRFYGLYNVNTGDGFSGAFYGEEGLPERIDGLVSTAAEQAGELEEKLKNTTAQQEMNEIASELYQTWDGALNAVWTELEAELGAEDMEALRTDERSWIAYRDEEAEAAGQKFAGGSMESMERNLTAAELTKERVYELAEYSRNR